MGRSSLMSSVTERHSVFVDCSLGCENFFCLKDLYSRTLSCCVDCCTSGNYTFHDFRVPFSRIAGISRPQTHFYIPGPSYSLCPSSSSCAGFCFCSWPEHLSLPRVVCCLRGWWPISPTRQWGGEHTLTAATATLGTSFLGGWHFHVTGCQHGSFPLFKIQFRRFCSPQQLLQRYIIENKTTHECKAQKTAFPVYLWGCVNITRT